jgi:hypothetical protein
MFVHINPELNALGETISTLKFAERVASIELGAARSNKETGEIRELKEEVCFSSFSSEILLFDFFHESFQIPSIYTDIEPSTGIGEEGN